MIFVSKNIKQGYELIKLTCLYACWIMHMKLSDGHKSLKYKEKCGTQHVVYLTGCLGSRAECAETTMEIGTKNKMLQNHTSKTY